ncbi:MAG: hypothetical protein KAT16_04390, partial [Candidatus Heimdallarchaeota archaeon]|nr:hypothetical protein [Candidatus Heimdallarchaeota archaeon]
MLSNIAEFHKQFAVFYIIPFVINAYNNLTKRCNKEQLKEENRWYADSDDRKQNLTNIWKQVESS